MSADTDRYLDACHAMQTGVAFEQNRGDKSLEPKHLRVGVNVAMCDHAALVKLLLDKGILTMEEYEKAIADQMEAEVAKYERRINETLGIGAKVTLR